MALEIERRFLVQASGWRSRVSWQARLRQGYLRTDPDGLTLRVRLSRAEAVAPGLAAEVRDIGGVERASAPACARRLAAAEEQAWLTLKAVPPSATDLAIAAHKCAPRDPVPQAAPAPPGPNRSGTALTRLEFEYAIPPKDAEQLLTLARGRVEKRRYGLDLPDGDWVVDVFEAENAPLVVAEVELPHASATLQLPAWCGVEVTGLHQLSNAALATRPLNCWPASERETLLAGLSVGLGPVQP